MVLHYFSPKKLENFTRVFTCGFIWFYLYIYYFYISLNKFTFNKLLTIDYFTSYQHQLSLTPPATSYELSTEPNMTYEIFVPNREPKFWYFRSCSLGFDASSSSSSLDKDSLLILASMSCKLVADLETPRGEGGGGEFANKLLFFFYKYNNI